MAFIGKGKETFIYLNGITPHTSITLDKGVSFAPAKCNPTPDEIISKSKSEIDIGIACIFLRNVSAYFHIEADTPKELAVKAWNAQWDAVLLSALFDCEVGCNFQSDVPPDNFADAEEFYITNYALKGINAGEIKKLTATNHKWITVNYSTAKNLLDNDRYKNAVHCLYSYRWHSMPRARLALLWSGIEGLFGVDYELSFRLSLYIAKYLSPSNKKKQQTIFNDVKNLYKVRSKAVHGGNLKDEGKAVQQSLEILRKLVTKSTEKGCLPKTDDLAP